jgi:hypothetical protein
VDESRFANWITIFDGEDKRLHITPSQFRWKPIAIPTDKKVNFFEGIQSMGGAGGPAMKVSIVSLKALEWSRNTSVCM